MEATVTKKQVNGKKIGKIIIDVFFWIVLAVSLVFTVLAFTAQASPVGMPTLGKTAFLTVQSDSMAKDDYFEKGDLIVCKVIKNDEQAIADLKEGDVVTFPWFVENEKTGKSESIFVTHMIQEVEDLGDNGRCFITHGVNNPEQMTERIHENDVVAKWNGKVVPGLGGFINFLQPPQWGFIVFIIIPLAGFLTYEIVYLVLVIRKMKGKDKRVISAAEEELIKQKAVEEFLAKQEAEKDASKEDKK